MKIAETKWYRRIEAFVDYTIPVAVLVLLVIIVTELFFHETADRYHSIILYADYTILVFFVADLIFKYIRIRNIKNFLRTCWLDIIAVFPFFLVFRLVEPLIFIGGLSAETRNVQLIFHESLEVSKQASKIAEEVEKAGKVSRIRRIVSLVRAAGHSPRIVKALAFYEQPIGVHHLHKPGTDQIKDVEKISKKTVDTVAETVQTSQKVVKKIVKKK